MALALALGHAVMAYLSDVAWLAKDVVWVLPDARCGIIDSAQVSDATTFEVDRAACVPGMANRLKQQTAPPPAAHSLTALHRHGPRSITTHRRQHGDRGTSSGPEPCSKQSCSR